MHGRYVFLYVFFHQPNVFRFMTRFNIIWRCVVSILQNPDPSTENFALSNVDCFVVSVGDDCSGSTSFHVSIVDWCALPLLVIYEKQLCIHFHHCAYIYRNGSLDMN